MSRPSIEPKVWQPPKATGTRRPPVSLPRLTVLQVNGDGTEDVVVDDNGHVFTGVADGRILRLTPDGRRLDTIAETGGRPLGLELYPDGRLLVCDADRGLLLVERGSGAVEVLIEAGPDLRLCNNAAVAADGTVYFTDSTSRFDLRYWMADLLEHSATGRLLRRDPSGDVEVLMHGLAFANGVALAPDESYVVVAESGGYRLHKHWLTGDSAGSHEPLGEVLQAFPDNIATGSDGLIWVALASPRDQLLDLLAPKRPALRKAVWALPEALQPKEKRTVWVRALDGDTGAVVHEFYGTPPDFHMPTGVRERDGTVYLGSLNERAIATFKVP